MPSTVINSALGIGILGHLDSSTDMSADLTVEKRLRGSIHGSTSMTALLTLGQPMEGSIDGQTSMSAFLRINSEANKLAEVNCQIELDCHFPPRRDLTAFVNCKIRLDVNPFPTHNAEETFPVEIIVDIIPDEDLSLTQEWVAEMILDDTTSIPIKSFNYNEGKNDVGNSLRIELAKIENYADILAASKFTFRVGSVVDAVTTWHNYIEDGILDSLGYSITRQSNAPITQIDFSNKSSVVLKLTRNPKRDLVIYNPIQVSVSSTDFEILHDVEGNDYLTELFPIAGLMLYDLFQNIFVTRLGFTSYITNIPNYPIKRVDFSFTETYLSSIAGLIGMFEPMIFEYQNKVWILDSTNVLPSGFPPSLQLGIANSTSIKLNQNHDKIDAYFLFYNENGLNFDFLTSRTDTFIEETGQFVDGNYTRTEITKTIQEYRRNEQPLLVIKSDILRERRETFDNLGALINRSIEEFTYDGQGRQTFSVKTQSGLIPDVETDGELTFLDTYEERISIQYGPDPFQPSRIMALSTWIDVRGLIAVDGENLFFDAPFKLDYMEALKSGNLKSGMTREFGLIKMTREQVTPLPNGQCQVETRVRDYIRNVVSRDQTEPRAGDFTINGSISRQRKVLVPYASDSLTKENPIIKRLSVGDLPTQYAIALANRKLKRQNGGPTDGVVGIPGTNFYLRRGLPVEISNASNGSMGNFLIEGFSVSGSQGNLVTEIQGPKIG